MSIRIALALVFFMNEFFRKSNCEYLLEQMGEISLESRVVHELSGTHEKEKRHLFLGEMYKPRFMRLQVALSLLESYFVYTCTLCKIPLPLSTTLGALPLN